MATLKQKWENIDYRPKAASTLFSNGWFISYDGAGGVIPAQSADLYGSATPILGVILEDVLASDVDFAGTVIDGVTYNRPVPFQYAHGFKFTVPVAQGTAAITMIGDTFDVDGTDPGAIDLSISGTQLTVVTVLADDLVEVEVALVEQEG